MLLGVAVSTAQDDATRLRASNVELDTLERIEVMMWSSVRFFDIELQADRHATVGTAATEQSIKATPEFRRRHCLRASHTHSFSAAGLKRNINSVAVLLDRDPAAIYTPDEIVVRSGQTDNRRERT